MKRYILLLIIISFINSSCDDFLKEVPKNRLSGENFYNTVDECESAVYAIYKFLDHYSLFDAQYLLITEIPADYAYGRGSTAAAGGEYTGFDDANIGRAKMVWDSFYITISYANFAIEEISKSKIEESKKSELIAEAIFLRAFCHYRLVRDFGAVPLRLNTSREDIGRTPVESVYNAIISDLEQSESDLPSIPVKYGRPTKWAAKSLLSEVYLTMEEWALAAEKAKEVIDSGEFGLVKVEKASDFDNLFGASVNGTEEEIFYIKNNHTLGSSWPFYLLYEKTTMSPYGAFVVYTDPENPFIKNWSNSDLRKQWDVFTEYVSSQTGDTLTLNFPPMCFSKFRDTGAPRSTGYANDFPILRYADVLLIYAEANAMDEGAPSSLAIEYLNKVKRRGYGYSPDSPSPVDYSNTGWTSETFQDAVLQERAYEFMSECKRWYDLKRTGKVEEVILAHKGKTVNEKMLLFPIPQEEIDVNSKISQEDQNPGY